MALAIDIIHGCGLSTYQITSSVTAKEDSVLVVNIAAKGIHYRCCTLLTLKTKRFSFKSGCVKRGAKCLEDFAPLLKNLLLMCRSVKPVKGKNFNA